MNRLPNLFSRTRCLVLFFGLFAFSTYESPGLIAQTDNPSIPANGFTEESKALTADCFENYATLRPSILKIEQLVRAGKTDRIDMKKLGKNAALANQIVRYSHRLRTLREPNSVDYSLKGESALQFIRDTISSAKTTTPGMAYTVKAEKYKISSTAKRLKSIEKVKQWIEKGKPEIAEREFEKVIMDVDTFLMWLNPNSTRQVLGQISSAHRQVIQLMTEERTIAATADLSAALKLGNPEIDKLLSQIQKSTEDIQRTGTTDIDGTSLNGPETMREFLLRWQTAHAKLIHCMTISNLGAPLTLKTTPADCIGTQLKTDDWMTASERLESKMIEMLPKLIRLDGQRSQNIQSAKKIYLMYLTTLADLVDPTSTQFLDACQKELSVFENREDELGTSISRYKSATADLLMWRQRSAQAAAKNQKMISQARSPGALKKITFIPNLTERLDVISPGLEQAIAGREFYAENVRTVKATNGYSQFSDHAWTAMPTVFDIDSEILSLEKDLLVTSQSPPLSLAATQAIATAKQGKYSAVGGSASTVKIEAFGNRFAKLPAAMNAIVPIAQLPTTNGELGNMLIRVNLNPTWVQHRYFFKKF
jgi:hypothetical protein